MDAPKADLVKRFVALFIDGIISAVPSVIPLIGPLIGAGYILTRDALMFELTDDVQWKNRSIGKKVMDIEVESEGQSVDWGVSFQRNLPLAIGSLIAVIPILGWIIGGIVGPIAALIELVLALTDDEGRRLGDRWAGTRVVGAPDSEGVTESQPPTA